MGGKKGAPSAGPLDPGSLRLRAAARRFPLLLESLEGIERRHIENVLRPHRLQKKAARIPEISGPTLDKESGARDRGPAQAPG